MILSDFVTCWGTSMLHCPHDRQKCFELLQPAWSPKVQMLSKEISQIHKGLLHQWQLDTMAPMQTQSKEIIFSLMLGLGRIYQEKYCPSRFPAAFVSVATIYQPQSQGVELDRPWLWFSFNSVFPSPEEFQSHVQRMKKWVSKFCKLGELWYTYFTDDMCEQYLTVQTDSPKLVLSDCSVCSKWPVQGLWQAGVWRYIFCISAHWFDS